MTTLAFSVFGLPAPQGSKSFKGMRAGHAVMVESSKKVKPWRRVVELSALAARGDMPTMTGPISVVMVFTLPKPKSAPKTRRTWPDRKPDLSKLVRSTEDALTSAKVWGDDAQVVYMTAVKCYPGEHSHALNVPGCNIVVRNYE